MGKRFIFSIFQKGGIAETEAKSFGISITTKVQEEESPWNLQIDQSRKRKGLDKQDIILGLDLLMKQTN